MPGGLKLSSLSQLPLRLPESLVKDALRRIFKDAAFTVVMSSPRFKSAMTGLNLAELFGMSAKATKIAAQWSNDYPAYSRLLEFVVSSKAKFFQQPHSQRVGDKLSNNPVILPAAGIGTVLSKIIHLSANSDISLS